MTERDPDRRNPKERLLEQVYSELHALAQEHMRRERRGHTLQPTALVNEAYVRLADTPESRWQGRTHFYAVAANTLRRVLVDHARRRAADKRGGDGRRVELDSQAHFAPAPNLDILALHEALEKLEQRSPRQGKVLELRFFAGLSVEETAEALGVSARTVKGDWAMARAWLLRELKHGERDG